MGNKLYVGNLPYSFRDNDLEQSFSQFGAVSSAKVMMGATPAVQGFRFCRNGQPDEAASRHRWPARSEPWRP